jgi:hypothetical protein
MPDMVSAWATANRLGLGQVKGDEKSNEIPAIPQLLEILEVSVCIVTIDAMGCQTEIAAKIIERGAEAGRFQTPKSCVTCEALPNGRD